MLSPTFFDISDNVLGYVNEEIPPDKMVQNEYITRMTSDRGSQCGAVLVAVNEVGSMISYISKMTSNKNHYSNTNLIFQLFASSSKQERLRSNKLGQY